MQGPPAPGGGECPTGPGTAQVSHSASGAGLLAQHGQDRGGRVRARLPRALFCSGRSERKQDGKVVEEPGLGGVPWLAWGGAGQTSVGLAAVQRLGLGLMALQRARGAAECSSHSSVPSWERWPCWLPLCRLGGPGLTHLGTGASASPEPLLGSGVSTPPSRVPLTARLTGGQRVSLLPWTLQAPEHRWELGMAPVTSTGIPVALTIQGPGLGHGHL